MVRRRSGYVRKLPSGRFQASYKTPDGQRHNAPETYRTEADAGRFLDRMQQEVERGTGSRTCDSGDGLCASAATHTSRRTPA
ncbi:hypothetical protein ASG96_18945 [Terrabacter sp. Soil810]|nr:hypothetical protein ASG96_18945 [Terrabacter sp. Soil810]